MRAIRDGFSRKRSYTPASFRFFPTFRTGKKRGWIAKGYYGLDQGPIVLMVENYRSGLLWRLMRDCSYVVTGLRRAGFKNGWLSQLS